MSSSGHTVVLTPQQIAILNFYKAYHNPNITGTFEPEIVDITAWTPYPFQFVIYLLCLYIGGCVVEALLTRFSEKYRNLPLSKQRIVVTYFHEIVVTTIVFLLQMVYGYSILRNNDHVPFFNVQMVRVCGYMLCGLYLWELIYRFEMGKPLMAHHVMTILLMQVFFPFIQEYPLLIVVRCALVVLLSATTEQISFIALLMFRFGFLANASAALFAAGVMSFIVKTIVCIVTLSVWGEFITTPEDYENCPRHWRNFLTYFFPFMYLFLYATQLIAVKIFFALALRTTHDYLKHNQAKGVRRMLKLVHLPTHANIRAATGSHKTPSSSPKHQQLVKATSSETHTTVVDLDPSLHPSMEAGARSNPVSDHEPRGKVPFLRQMTAKAFWSFTDDAESRAQWKPRVRSNKSRSTRGLSPQTHENGAVAECSASVPVASSDLSGPAVDGLALELASVSRESGLDNSQTHLNS